MAQTFSQKQALQILETTQTQFQNWKGANGFYELAIPKKERGRGNRQRLEFVELIDLAIGKKLSTEGLRHTIIKVILKSFKKMRLEEREKLNALTPAENIFLSEYQQPKGSANWELEWFLEDNGFLVVHLMGPRAPNDPKGPSAFQSITFFNSQTLIQGLKEKEAKELLWNVAGHAVNKGIKATFNPELLHTINLGIIHKKIISKIEALPKE